MDEIRNSGYAEAAFEAVELVQADQKLLQRNRREYFSPYPCIGLSRYVATKRRAISPMDQATDLHQIDLRHREPVRPPNNALHETSLCEARELYR